MTGLRDFYEGTVAMGEDREDTGITRAELRLMAAARLVPEQVLDLGCGAGSNTLSLFGPKQPGGGPRVYGLDLSLRSVDVFRRRTGFPGVGGSGVALPLADGSVDLVVCNDVVEHVPETDLLVREIRRVLVPGGHLLLSTPNLSAWFNRLAMLAGYQPAFSEVSYEKIFGRPGTDPVGHLRMFTPRALLPFLAHHGFDVLHTAAAPFPAVPTPLRGLDRVLSRSLSLGAITVVLARSR